MIIKKQTIPWQPFSQKHKDYIKRGLVADISVAEGAIRSGKTIDNCIIAAAHLETCKDRIHLASGSTLGNAKLNIGDCNGFGLEHQFRGRCHWGKYKDNPALTITTKTGDKIVVFAGGKQADSYKKILGNSYGLWIATEINEHYDCEDSKISFIKVAQGRQIAAVEPKTLWDLNPSDPNALIYSNYIDRYKDGYAGDYNYQLFTLHDNLTITPERMKIIESVYTPGTVWHSRDILGQRVVAEGLVFRYLADSLEPYLVDVEYDKKTGKCKENYTQLCIGMDFGGSKSMTTECLTGYKGYESIVHLEEDSLPITEEINADMIMDMFCKNYEKWSEVYGYIAYVFPDNASPTLINQIRSVVESKRYPCQIVGCDKPPILNRAQFQDAMLTSGRLKFRRGTKELPGAMATLQYENKKNDSEEDRIEDKNVHNCNDWWDGHCYSWTTFMPYLERGY